MSDLKLSFVIEKKLFSFLDAPEKSLADAVHLLTEAYADKYAVKNIELRNDSCPKEAYPAIIDRFKPEIEQMQKNGFEFTLHAARAIQHSENLDRDILAVLRSDIEMAKALGISIIVTHASFSVRFPEGKDYYSIMHLLPELNALSLETGVKIAIENISLKNGVLQNTNDHFFILDYMNKNNLDNLGIGFDFGHALSCGFSTDYAVKVIEKAQKKFFHIHAHETDFGEDLHASLGGKLDWKDIFQSMEKIGYSGAFVLEMKSPSLSKSLEYLQSINATFKS